MNTLYTFIRFLFHATFFIQAIQFSQKRIMIRFDFKFSKKSRRRKIKDLIVRRKDMKKNKFDFRDENLKREFNVNINSLRYEKYADKMYF